MILIKIILLVLVCIMLIFIIYKSTNVTKNKQYIYVVLTGILAVISILPNKFIYEDLDKKILYSKIYFSEMKNGALTAAIEHISNEVAGMKMENPMFDIIEAFPNFLPSPFMILSKVVSSYQSSRAFPNIPEDDIKELNAFVLNRIELEKESLSKINAKKPWQIFLSDIDAVLNHPNERIVAIQGNSVRSFSAGTRIAHEIEGLFYSYMSKLFSDCTETYSFIAKYEDEYIDLIRQKFN